MTNDAAVLLVGARQEAGYVDERYEWNIEGVAGAHETRGLFRRFDVETAREHLRLVADDADDMTVDPREPTHDVERPERMHFEEIAVVDDLRNELLHVVGLVGCVGDQIDDVVATPVGIVVRFEVGRVLEIVRRKKREEVAHLLEAALLVGCDERGHPRFRSRASSRRRAPLG